MRSGTTSPAPSGPDGSPSCSGPSDSAPTSPRATDPAVLVLDEPVSALDVSIQAQVLDLLSDLQQALGTAHLFISHDLGVIHHVSDRVLVMQGGRIVDSGTADAVFFTPQHDYTRQLIAALPRPDLEEIA